MSILQEIRRLRMQAQLGSDAVNLLVCLLEEREQRGGDPAFPLRDRALLGLLEMSPHRFRNARAELMSAGVIRCAVGTRATSPRSAARGMSTRRPHRTRGRSWRLSQRLVARVPRVADNAVGRELAGELGIAPGCEGVAARPERPQGRLQPREARVDIHSFCIHAVAIALRGRATPRGRTPRGCGSWPPAC